MGVGGKPRKAGRGGGLLLEGRTHVGTKKSKGIGSPFFLDGENGSEEVLQALAAGVAHKQSK